MEITNPPTQATTTDQKDLHLTSTEPKNLSLPPLALDELDDQVLEDIVGGLNTGVSATCPIGDF